MERLESQMSNDENNVAYWDKHTHLLADDEYVCSSCGYTARRPYPECPNCGCDMSKGSSDTNWVEEAAIMDIFF